jgi:Acyl-CoA dehydrogenase, C-terminal domain
MARLLEAQQAWTELSIYQLDRLSKADGDALGQTSSQLVLWLTVLYVTVSGNRYLGGLTALLKANASLVLEPVASAAVQILGGIGYTRGGKGEGVERIYREVKSYAIPGGSEDGEREGSHFSLFFMLDVLTRPLLQLCWIWVRCLVVCLIFTARLVLTDLANKISRSATDQTRQVEGCQTMRA